ncbi:MAG TPA: SCO family protein, partial [Acidobacteriota bacterium]|nr:SCO family protein [Acidobacteriota bacterium]
MTQKIQIGIVGLIAFFAFHGLFGQLQNTRPEGLKNVGLDQKLNSQVPMDLEFSDSTGRSVLLGDLFNERPVILTLVYYECPMLCTMVLNGTLKAIRTLEFTVGEDFDIVTVSIDPGETPGLAAEKKAQYLDSYRRESGSRGWYFLTGEEDQIRQLADSVGFRYEYNEETD